MNNRLETAVIALPMTETHEITDASAPIILSFAPIVSSLAFEKNGLPFQAFFSIVDNLITITNVSNGDMLRVNYKPFSAVEWNIPKQSIINEIPQGIINGLNATFQTSFDFIPESVQLFLNGLTQKLIDDYQTIGTRTIVLNNPISANEHILINYERG
jgi:hypothetical protein